MKTLVGLSRFVIVDVSGPSVPQELAATVPDFKIPFVPVIEAGRKPYSLLPDILEYPWLLKPVAQFANPQQMREVLRSRVKRAEARLASRQKTIANLFGRQTT